MHKAHTASESWGEDARWKQARQAAFVQDVRAAFSPRRADLQPFEDVRRKLQLGEAHELGLQDVPLDHIVGSAGRYQDFTRAFFPRRDDLRDRWRRVERLLASGHSLPPVDLYKVGQVYFVRDGNHRVSVARQYKMSTIRAYVWEFETHVPLDPDSDVDELLGKMARETFLETTGLDRACPDLDIKLSEPDGYRDLLAEIEAYQVILSTIDGEELPFDQAVTLWCEMRYTPIVDIIRRHDVLQDFPGRTEADLYLWLCRNQEELQAGYGRDVLMEESAVDLDRRFGGKFRPSRYARKLGRPVVEAAARGASALWGRLRRALRRLRAAR